MFRKGEKMLGIIGGMGPLASSLFYDMVTAKTQAPTDQENLNILMVSHATMPDRTAAILSGDPERIADIAGKLRKDAMLLAGAGCGAICVTCNTAHYFVNMIEKEVPVPFIHLIREAVKEIAKSCAGERVAILATDGTVRTGLYQNEFEAYDIEPYSPSADTQKKVMSEIYDRIKAGKKADAAMWEDIDREIRAAGCKAALLACTELPIVKHQLSLPDDYYYDPMDIMAERAVEFFRARGEIK